MTAFVLPQLLTSAAERAPGRIAVADAGGQVTYADLECWSNRLARVLRDAGVQAGDRVGVYLPKSVEAIAGLYGIMRAGAAYVPLDPFAPVSRLAYITRNCDIRCLVTGRQQEATWGRLAAEGTPLTSLVVLDAYAGEIQTPGGMAAFCREAIDTAPGASPDVDVIDQDLAYILYTSGSTGQPKGVMISHLNALTFVRWCHRYFTPTPEDIFSNHAPLHFDLSIFDLYVAAMAEAEVFVVPPEMSVFPVQLAEFIERHAISIWYSVPSVLTMLALRGNLSLSRLPSLRHIIFAGEVFPTKHLRQLMRLLPHAQFTNLYGPTETNVCTYHTVTGVPEDQTEPIPIGQAIDNVEVFAVTEDGRRAIRGEIGELYVRGTTVAYGYWGDPERTTRGFPTNPMGPAQDRTYRTGDLVRQSEDGNYLFLGRRDHQIKSRGYRIELGDIEAALYSHPEVEDCAVIPIPDEVVGNRLKAYVVLKDASISDADLVAFSARLLPRYMIPEFFEMVSQLPKTSTGKVDRTALASTVTVRV